MKKERKTVRALVVWILVAVIVLEGGAIAYLAQLCSKTEMASMSGTALADAEYGERQDMCNHFRAVSPTGYTGIISYYIVTGEDGTEIQYATEDEVLLAFSEEITKDIETPQEGAGKSVVAAEYRYCQDCGIFYEYGTLTITTFVQTIEVTDVKDFFADEEYDKICHIQESDDTIISYCFRWAKDIVVQLFSDWIEALTGYADTKVYYIDVLAYQLEEEALYTPEEYQAIIDGRDLNP